MVREPVYQYAYEECPLTFALSMIGGKWRLPVIWALSKNGTMRTRTFKRAFGALPT
jgi:DNA-binding HxlR family transcriptional regulator